MEKKIIINQFFGLGDILFIEPIYRWYHEQGYQVYAPVEDHYYWLMYYIKYVHFRKRSEFNMDYEQCRMDYTYQGSKVVPLRFSTPILRNLEPHDGPKEHFMLDKYRLLGLPENKWRELTWTRNPEREEALFKMLGLKEGDKYNFVNMNFGGGFQKLEIEVEVEGKNVYMDKIHDFTMLDWAKVIENAHKIYTVETSVIYMIEVLKLKAKEMHMYPRKPHEDTVHGVKNFISKKWILHEGN